MTKARRFLYRLFVYFTPSVSPWIFERGTREAAGVVVTVVCQSLKAFELNVEQGYMLYRRLYSSYVYFSSFTHNRPQLMIAVEDVGVRERARARAVCVYICLPTYACVEKLVVVSFKPVSNQRASLAAANLYLEGAGRS